MRKNGTPPQPESGPPMWSFDPQAFDAFVKSYESWSSDWGRLQDESLRFLRHRLERNVEAATSLANCKSPAEALEMQMRFAGDAFNDYVAESHKMVELFQRTASATATKASPRG